MAVSSAGILIKQPVFKNDPEDIDFITDGGYLDN